MKKPKLIKLHYQKMMVKFNKYQRFYNKKVKKLWFYMKKLFFKKKK